VKGLSLGVSILKNFGVPGLRFWKLENLEQDLWITDVRIRLYDPVSYKVS